ncbi:MAG: hypothetical protein HC939_17520 [Pleurocapsa sp. SU_5_0]|nr:hypothetical protein [Pleurocapsa sp. SU_5_0]NJO95736.1 hypothetical protein [Pleurocapsa sp. CRU_1_2]NJR47104.1 hypothetical protein [Hyellaceae cyanobacterium CSU_1_1]
MIPVYFYTDTLSPSSIVWKLGLSENGEQKVIQESLNLAKKTLNSADSAKGYL